MEKRSQSPAMEELVHNVLLGGGPEGLSLGELEEVLGPRTPDRRTLKRLLRDLTRTGLAVRTGKQSWTARERDEQTRGVLGWNGRDHTVEVDGGEVVLLLPQGLGPAVVGDRVRVQMVAEPGGAPRVARVIDFEPCAPRVVRGTVRQLGERQVVESDMVGEPMLLRDDQNPLPEGTEAQFRVQNRSSRSIRLKGIPKRPLLVERIDEVQSDTERPLPSARQAFALVRRGEMNATRLLDQLANSLRVDLPFSEQALAIADACDAPTEVEGEDLTGEPLVTIDGATAKDFDDAVMAEAIGPEIRLLVAIADVSHYVPEDSLLDAEARERGCSVYLPGRVYPMLPFRLSDDLCSLRPGVLRRCAWVSMIVDEAGDVVDVDAGFGTMRSRHRLTYEEVQGFLDGGELAVDADVAPSLHALDEVRRRLHRKRVQRGMLDLDLPETEIRLSEDGSGVREVEPGPRLRAHRLIEECMLAANESVASLLTAMGWPQIRRVHRDPSDERVLRVARIGASIGVGFKRQGIPTVEELNAALARVQGRPESRALSYLLLRALSAAEYAVSDEGHYGIGAPAYLHFTSPIRRYPDLEVHRVLRRALNERRPRGARLNALRSRLETAAEKSNRGEKLATRAERYATRLLSARFMLDRVGESFRGVVMEVAAFGLFVALESPNVEGMIPIRSLGREFFEFDEEQLCMRGTSSGTTWRVGTRVRVRCVGVQLEDGRVEFGLDGDGQVRDEDDAGASSAGGAGASAAWGVGESGLSGASGGAQPRGGKRATPSRQRGTGDRGRERSGAGKRSGASGSDRDAGRRGDAQPAAAEQSGPAVTRRRTRRR